jgi:hypothetical protein
VFQILVAFFILLPVLGQNTPAQSDRQTVAEPDFAEIFYRLDAGKLVLLERQSMATMHSGTGFGSYNTKSILPGNRSPVRFRAGEPLEFVVRQGQVTGAQDPATAYHLRPLAVKKKTRELAIVTVHATGLFSATSKMDAAVDELPVEFARYGNSSIRLTTKPLPPGEYALGQSYGGLGLAVYCFGVDK